MRVPKNCRSRRQGQLLVITKAKKMLDKVQGYFAIKHLLGQLEYCTGVPLQVSDALVPLLHQQSGVRTAHTQLEVSDTEHDTSSDEDSGTDESSGEKKQQNEDVAIAQRLRVLLQEYQGVGIILRHKYEEPGGSLLGFDATLVNRLQQQGFRCQLSYCVVQDTGNHLFTVRGVDEHTGQFVLWRDKKIHIVPSAYCLSMNRLQPSVYFAVYVHVQSQVVSPRAPSTLAYRLPYCD